MKKINFILIVFFVILESACAQNYSHYSNLFTPRDSIRALVIFVGFGSNFDSKYYYGGWDDVFPNQVYDKKAFYNELQDFNTPISSRDSLNVSRWFYEMTKQSTRPFKFMVDTIKVNLNLANLDTVSSWASLNREVIKQMQRDRPFFNWSRYDKRIYSNYIFDNSINPTSDGIVDYVGIIYRFFDDMTKDPLWPKELPIPWYGGYANIGYANGMQYNGYTIKEGFHQTKKISNLFGILIHELAHTNYNKGQHYAGGEVGNYFYASSCGWGLMNLGDQYLFLCANAWERWYWGLCGDNNPIQANNVISDIKPPSGSGTYILRDFLTYGDAICIEIPADTNTTSNRRMQRLWLENHQMNSIYDNRQWKNIGNSNLVIPKASKGIYVFIDDHSGNRNTDSRRSIYNYFKYLHSKGNYDYVCVDSSQNSNVLWNNKLYHFNEVKANPYSGQNRWESIKLDLNNDGKIGNTEQKYILYRNGVLTYDFAGIDAAFQQGQKLGIATNPPLTNYPLFLSLGNDKAFEPFILNGIQVEIVSQNSDGSMTVRVSYNKVDIENDYRMSARKIELLDITGNSNPDLRLLSNKTLTIDRSGSVRRENKTAGYYSYPTTFTCHNGSYFRMEAGSTVIISDSTTFVLRSGSKLEIDSGAVFIIKAGSKLDIQSGATLIVRGNGGIIVECNGTISATPNTVNLINNFSCIHLLTGSGSSITSTSGLGMVCNHQTAAPTVTISGVLSGYNYFLGKIINSNATINSGANVKYNVTEEVNLDPDFEVQNGAEFEINIYKNNCQ